jgi:hypothetical protein
MGLQQQNQEKAGHMNDTSMHEHRGSYRGWSAVIGDPEFAQNAMDNHAVAKHRRHRTPDYQQVLDLLSARIYASAHPDVIPTAGWKR